MIHSTIINPTILASEINNPDWVVVDCRFSLDDTEKGGSDYLKGHIPGAVYAHLDRELSGPILPGQSGRHPLPEPEEFVKSLGKWGIGNGVQVVVYDDSGGAFAARLWWMLRWLGHDAAAVLDGGWSHWLRSGLPMEAGSHEIEERSFSAKVNMAMIATTEEVDSKRSSSAVAIVDSRSADRYRGENETIDPVAGRIPSAVCFPYQENLGEDGLFKSIEEIESRFQRLTEGYKAEETIFYCGSGVSAAHNLLAMAHAGLPMGRLYVGSWSQWIQDPQRPVETG